MGDTANEAGAYSMLSVPAGTYDLTASFIGYEPITKSIVVGEEDVMTHFILEVGGLALSDVEVMASRASDKTPVFFTNVTKEEFGSEIGSQDIPMILNTTPSVYATNKVVVEETIFRINIRGFNQRNIYSNDKRSSTKRYGKWLGLLV